jgi:hypothetical protein
MHALFLKYFVEALAEDILKNGFKAWMDSARTDDRIFATLTVMFDLFSQVPNALE